MEPLKFTIITPSFNQASFIEDTISSVLNQQYTNFEYFVIDGGSTDHSVEIIRKYEDRINYWVSEKDRGQSHALNKGLQRATGDILIWINSDDILEPNALQKASEYFQGNPSVNVVHGRTILFRNNSQLIKGSNENCLPEQYLSGMAFPQPSAFIRRSAITNHHITIEESLHYGMDYDLFVQLYLNGSFLSVPEVFSRYRLHSESKTVMTNEGFAKDWQKVFSKVINTLADFGDIKDDLASLSMWHPLHGSYTKSQTFDSEFVYKSFVYFLNFQINFYYQDLKLDRVKEIGRFLKTRFPEFYKSQNIKRLHLMSTIPFARYLIPLVRKSTL